MKLVEKTVRVTEREEWFYLETAPTQQPTQKPPVVLLHGLPSRSLCWGEIMPALTIAGRHAIAPDWIGFGGSSKPAPFEFEYNPDGFVAALGRFLESMELTEFSLVVQGFLGGSAGLQYALRHPDRVERLVILNTPLSGDAKLPLMMRMWGWPLLGEMQTQDPLLVDRALETGSGRVIADENLDIYRRPLLKSSMAGRILTAAIRNLRLNEATAELEAGLPAWPGQVALVWGMADPWLDGAFAKKLAAAPNFELLELPEAGHYPQEHWSGEIAPAIVNFLARQAL